MKTHSYKGLGNTNCQECGDSLNAHPRKFRDLAIGDTFDCIGPNRYNSFFQTCKKISARKYTDGRFTYRVDTINCEVFHVNENPVATVQRVNTEETCNLHFAHGMGGDHYCGRPKGHAGPCRDSVS